MNTTYSTNKMAVKITGDYSPHPVFAMVDIVKNLGGENSAYHEIKRLQNRHFMPRMGGESRPLTCRDLVYAYDNEGRGFRHWQYRSFTGGYVFKSTGYDSVWGYGYFNNDTFIIINNKSEIVFRVKIPSLDWKK